MIENIFFSFSFSEFTSLVELVAKRVNESVMLQRCGLIPHHLAKLESYKQAPLENSLYQVRKSRYVVCLLGQNAGSEVHSGKTYIEYELEAALEADVDVFAFLVGESYQTTDDVPKDIARLYQRLSEKITVGTIPTDDMEVIARHITRALESDVWQALGDDDQYAISDNLLAVSGFQYRNIERLPAEIGNQLSRVYNTGAPSNQGSPIAANLVQRKCWAYESLQFGHIEDAIKNLQKVIAEFGADFFSGFWLGRLFALHSTKDDQLRKVSTLVERTLSMLDDNETLLRSLCYCHLAVASAKLGDDLVAEQYFINAEENYKTYDIFEYRADMSLKQIATEKYNNKPLSYWLDLATESLAYIQRSRLSYFVQVHARLEQTYGLNFNAVDEQLKKKRNAFLNATVVSNSGNQQWAENNFGFKVSKKICYIDPNSDLMESAYKASETIWLGYQALNFSAKKIASRFQTWDHKRCEIETKLEQLESDYSAANSFIEEYHEKFILMVETKDELEFLESKLQYSRRRENIYLASTFVFITIVFSILSYFTEVPFPTVFVPILLVIPILYSSLNEKIENINNIFIGKKQFIHSINNDINLLSSKISSDIFDEHLIMRLLGFYENIGALSSAEFEKFNQELIGSYWENFQLLSNNQLLLDKELAELSRLAFVWYSKVDKLEQFSVSAHNGQYNHLLSRKTRVKVARRIELGFDCLSSIMTTEEQTDDLKGRVLHIKGSRLRAWFDDFEEASQMLKTLSGAEPKSANQEKPINV